jgi:hypothetical protein
MKKLIFLFLIPLCFSASADDSVYEKLNKLDIEQKEEGTDAMISLGAASTLGVTSHALQNEGAKLNIKQIAKEFIQRPAELKRVRKNLKVKRQNGLSTKSANKYLKVLNDKNYTKKEKDRILRNSRLTKGTAILAGVSFLSFVDNLYDSIKIREEMHEIIKCNPFMLESTHKNKEISQDLADLMIPVSMIEDN